MQTDDRKYPEGQKYPEVEKSPVLQLMPRLSLYTATRVVIGSMVGSGVFKKPAVMAAQLPDSFWLLATWFIAAVLTLFAALCNAEIAGAMPQAGGQYVFFRRIYNDFVGFLYGWAVFAVIQTGSIASITYIFAEYAGYFVPLPRLSAEQEAVSFTLLGVIKITPFAQIGVKLLTAAAIAVLTTINIIAVVFGAAVQNFMTTAKLIAIGAVVLFALSADSGNASHILTSNADVGLAQGLPFWGALSMALSGAFWAFDGWNNVTYISAEVRNAERNIPKALLMGTATVAVVYALTNIAYLYVLPIDEMSKSQLVAADVMLRAVGPWGAAAISALVMFSTFGTANGTILASARVYFAMARDGLFFSPVGRLHPRYQTPAISLAIQAFWAILLVFSGSFDQLTDMLIFVSWVFYALGALGVIIMRKKMPTLHRPYHVRGYPWIPIVFVVVAVGYVCLSFTQNPRDALFGLLLVAMGVPLYFWYRRSKGARTRLTKC